MPRSPNRFRDVETTRKNRPLVYALNWLVIVVAFAAIAGLLISAIAEAFLLGFETGFKGLAAAALPPIILTYSNFFSRLFKASDGPIEINLFVVGILWIIALLLFVNLVTLQLGDTVPLNELAISITLSSLFYLSRQISRRSLLSCSYGILSGFLIYLLIFGLPG